MGKGKKRGIAPFFQSANVVSLRDKSYYLGPVVCIHPRKLTFSRGPGHGMTRKVVCAGAQSINYLGPVVKPRDDKKDVIAYYLGPVVKPRDDKFFSYFSFFLNKLQI